MALSLTHYRKRANRTNSTAGDYALNSPLRPSPQLEI